MNKMRRQLALAGRLYETMQEAADAAVNKHNDLCDEYDLKSSRLISGTIENIDEYGVTIDWYETWSYGGYDEGQYDLTADELDPETNEAAFRAKLEAIVAKNNKKAQDKKAAEERAERAQLAKLQEKYNEN